MSKPNKANKNNYSQAGRLTPDQMGRERDKQMAARPAETFKAKADHPRATGERAPTRPRSAPEE
jgi:hypothetical protein